MSLPTKGDPKDESLPKLPQSAGRSEPQRQPDQPQALVVPEDRLLPRNRRPEPEPPPPPPAPQRRGCMGTCALFSGLSLLVMTVVIGFMMLSVFLDLAGFLGDPIDNFLSVFGFDDDADPVVVDSRTIVLGIQNLALLQTASGDILIDKTVVDASTAPDSRLKMSYVGHVTVGIDLAQMADADVIVNPDNSLTVQLPPAQITGCYLTNPDIIDASCTDIPFGIQDCDDVLEKLQETAYKRSIEELLETALELDLTSLAVENAETAIYDLLSKLGYGQIEFRRSLEVLPPHETCTP